MGIEEVDSQDFDEDNEDCEFESDDDVYPREGEAPKF